jgi:hypothetical protein
MPGQREIGAVAAAIDVLMSTSSLAGTEAGVVEIRGDIPRQARISNMNRLGHRFLRDNRDLPHVAPNRTMPQVGIV